MDNTKNKELREKYNANNQGRFLEEMIKKNGMTQEEFAKRIGVEERTVIGWIRGDNKGVLHATSKNMMNILKVLGITYKELEAGKTILGERRKDKDWLRIFNEHKKEKDAVEFRKTVTELIEYYKDRIEKMKEWIEKKDEEQSYYSKYEWLEVLVENALKENEDLEELVENALEENEDLEELVENALEENEDGVLQLIQEEIFDSIYDPEQFVEIYYLDAEEYDEDIGLEVDKLDPYMIKELLVETITDVMSSMNNVNNENRKRNLIDEKLSMKEIKEIKEREEDILRSIGKDGIALEKASDLENMIRDSFDLDFFIENHPKKQGDFIRRSREKNYETPKELLVKLELAESVDDSYDCRTIRRLEEVGNGKSAKKIAPILEFLGCSYDEYMHGESLLDCLNAKEDCEKTLCFFRKNELVQQIESYEYRIQIMEEYLVSMRK